MDPQRRGTFGGEDLIKKTQKPKEDVKWRKGTRGSRNRVHCCLGCSPIFSFLFTTSYRRKQKNQLKMALTKLPGLSIVLTLSLQTLLIQGETFLEQETNKETGAKLSEKRNNFRVPMETPFDPNFWPARGRRSRKDPEKPTQTENCMTEEGYNLEKNLQCQELLNGNRKLQVELLPNVDLGEELMLGGEKTESDCYGKMSRMSDRTRGRLGLKVPEILDGGSKDFDDVRHKKIKHTGTPQLILYGNGVYWEPENLFGEKKKKQDVFWVARGKKNFNINYP